MVAQVERPRLVARKLRHIGVLTTLVDPRLNSLHDIFRQFLEDGVGVQPGRAHKPRLVNVAMAARVAAPHARVVRRLGGQMEALINRGGVAQRTINCLIGHKILASGRRPV